MAKSERCIDMLFRCLDRGQFAFTHCAHVCNDHFRVRLLVLVVNKLMRKQRCPRAEPGPTDMFVFQLAVADPGGFIVVLCKGGTSVQGQGSCTEGSHKKVPIHVQQQVLERATKQ